MASNGTANGQTSTGQNGAPTVNGAQVSGKAVNGTAPANDKSTIVLSDRLAVHRSPEEFGSYAYSLVSLPAGALFAPITGTTSATKAYSSVQTGPNTHIELNSELLYCNQSCAPSLEFDMATMEVRVARDRALKARDALTFWYPSTEWDMAQPFKCECKSDKCKGYINGAGQMDEAVVREYWLNEHIEKMLQERASKQAGQNGVGAPVQNGH